MIKKISLMLVCVGCIIAGLFWYISPIFKPFPKPTGPYTIGTTSLFFIGQKRNDPYAATSKKRAILTRIWDTLQEEPQR